MEAKAVSQALYRGFLRAGLGGTAKLKHLLGLLSVNRNVVIFVMKAHISCVIVCVIPNLWCQSATTDVLALVTASVFLAVEESVFPGNSVAMLHSGKVMQTRKNAENVVFNVAEASSQVIRDMG